MNKLWYGVTLLFYAGACWGGQEAKIARSQVAVAPFNAKITAYFSRALTDVITRGVVLGYTCENNTLMCVMKKQQKEVSAGKLSHVPLSEELIMKAALDPVYQDLLNSARQQQRKGKEEGNKAWAEFRKRAPYCLGRTIEQDSKIVINAVKQNVPGILERNRMLSSADQQRYAAGMIALFSLIQMAEEGIQ